MGNFFITLVGNFITLVGIITVVGNFITLVGVITSRKFYYTCGSDTPNWGGVIHIWQLTWESESESLGESGRQMMDAYCRFYHWDLIQLKTNVIHVEYGMPNL